MGELLIHIGTHKTGSVAIQRSLRTNRRSLIRDGIVFLELPPEIRSLMRRDELDEELVRRLRSFLVSHGVAKKPRGGTYPRFLLSWEGLSGNPLSGYGNASVVAESIMRATTEIPVSIIVYLRRQDDFVESLYTQMIHEGNDYSFESFVGSLPQGAFDWNLLLNAYAARFGKERVIVRRYAKDHLPEPDSLLLDFYTTLGLSPHEAAEQLSTTASSTPNRGYSPAALEIARLSNPVLDPGEKKQLRLILQQIGSKQPFDRYSLWSYQDRKAYIDSFLGSNRQVASSYLLDPSGELFKFDDIEESSSHHPTTLERILPIIVKMALTERPKSRGRVVSLLPTGSRRRIGAFLAGRLPKLHAKLMAKLRRREY